MNYKNLSILLALAMSGNIFATMPRANSSPALSMAAGVPELRRTASAPAVSYTEVNVSSLGGRTVTVRVPVDVEGAARNVLLCREIARVTGRDLCTIKIVGDHDSMSYLVNPFKLIPVFNQLVDKNGQRYSIVRLEIQGLATQAFLRINYLADETEENFQIRLQELGSLQDLINSCTEEVIVFDSTDSDALFFSRNDLPRVINELSVVGNAEMTIAQMRDFMDNLDVEYRYDRSGVANFILRFLLR